MTDVLVDREVLGYALFALGRFVDYRISDGMSEDAVHPFMQAYLDLEAMLDDREPPCLRELQSQTVVVPPALMPETQTITPAWLPDGEKLRHIRRAHGMTQCTAAPDAQL